MGQGGLYTPWGSGLQSLCGCKVHPPPCLLQDSSLTPKPRPHSLQGLAHQPQKEGPSELTLGQVRPRADLGNVRRVREFPQNPTQEVFSLTLQTLGASSGSGVPQLLKPQNPFKKLDLKGTPVYKTD